MMSFMYVPGWKGNATLWILAQKMDTGKHDSNHDHNMPRPCKRAHKRLKLQNG